MNRPISYLGTANQSMDKVMEPEQFTQVVEAILQGKYSWACVLILRFAGYNPLHYIPYRTYNRLVKDNSSIKSLNTHLSKDLNQKQANQENNDRHFSSSNNSQTNNSHKSLHLTQDLAHLEFSKEPSSKIRGGLRSWFLG